MADLEPYADRLEAAMTRAFDGINKVESIVAKLTDLQAKPRESQLKFQGSQITLQDRQSCLEESHLKLHQELAERGQKTDDSIQVLLRSIAELVRRDNGKA